MNPRKSIIIYYFWCSIRVKRSLYTFHYSHICLNLVCHIRKYLPVGTQTYVSFSRLTVWQSSSSSSSSRKSLHPKTSAKPPTPPNLHNPSPPSIFNLKNRSMPVTQSTCTSNFPPNPNSAVPLPPYSLSCSALSSAASTFFTRSKNPIFKSNSAPFLRAKPQRGARLIASAAGTDYYKTLNVLRTATLQEIKSAYRKVSYFFLLFIFQCVLFAYKLKQKKRFFRNL